MGDVVATVSGHSLLAVLSWISEGAQVNNSKIPISMRTQTNYLTPSVCNIPGNETDILAQEGGRIPQPVIDKPMMRPREL